jgi:pimeloyl-ACP methyl ester carboxylesterase
VRRAFVALSDSGRQVHYRMSGSGAPLVLLHATPDSSAGLNVSSPDRAVLALDVPGYGLSDPLGVAEPSMEDYARNLAETFDALGLDAAEVVGWGSGANMAASFAQQYPERATSVRMHDRVRCAPDERDYLLTRYAPSLAPEWDGTHLLRAWMIRRDMHLFRPWFARTPAARLGADLPPPDQLQREFLDLLQAGDHWGDAQLAALREGTPTARAELRAGKTGSFTRGYADVPFGQVHLWRVGPRRGVPLIMLHASPGSSRGVLPLGSALAADRDIIAVDTPGFGDSDPLPGDDPSIGDFADALLHTIDSLGAYQVDLFGTHTGACIALEAAARGPNRIRKVVFDGLPMFTPEERADHLANYVPPFEVRWDGSHVVWAWNFVRNMALFYPWYQMNVRHSTGRVPDTALLHERVVDIMKAGPNYAKGYRAVYRHDPRPALTQLQSEALLCVSREDVLAHHAEAVRQARPDLRIEWVASQNRLAATAATIKAFLG